jgi:hypothetical protein
MALMGKIEARRATGGSTAGPRIDMPRAA